MLVDAKLAEKPPGELTITTMDDPKTAVAVAEALKAALETSVAAGYLARTRSCRMSEDRKLP